MKKMLSKVSQNPHENPWSLFLNKVAGLLEYPFKVEGLRCFPVNFAKFLRTLFFIEQPGDCFCLLLQLCLRNSFDSLKELSNF